MTRKISAIICLFIVSTIYSQDKTTINFNDGTSKTGEYTLRKPTFANSSSRLMAVSKDKKEKYTMDKFSSVIVYKDGKELFYEVIDVKTNFDDKKTEKKLGFVAYGSPKMKVYFVAETIHAGGTVGMHSTYGSSETYVKRAKDSIAYNMGYIYGAAARGIKKRVQDYFTDCPKLIEQVENDSIDKKDIKAIIEFYEKNCGN